jgi:hypothetical protein
MEDRQYRAREPMSARLKTTTKAQAPFEMSRRSSRRKIEPPGYKARTIEAKAAPGSVQ